MKGEKMIPKPLNLKSEAIFNNFIKPIKNNGSYIQYGKPGGAMMPLTIEKLYTGDNKTQYSFCHYYKQNGDMCQDPEMVFLVNNSGKIFPMFFQQAIPPIFSEGLFFDDGLKMRPHIYKDILSFANQWMRNLKNQDYLNKKKTSDD